MCRNVTILGRAGEVVGYVGVEIPLLARVQIHRSRSRALQTEQCCLELAVSGLLPRLLTAEGGTRSPEMLLHEEQSNTSATPMRCPMFLIRFLRPFPAGCRLVKNAHMK